LIRADIFAGTRRQHRWSNRRGTGCTIPATP